MGKNELMEKIDQMSDSLSTPDLKKIEELISEIVAFFGEIREKLQSTDERDRESALADVRELQSKLETFSQKAIAASGMSREQLSAFVANPNNFALKDWSKLKAMEHSFKSKRGTL